MSRAFDPTLYSGSPEIKADIRTAGLTIRDVALAVGFPPGTLRSKLNGEAPLPESERKAIKAAIQELVMAGGAA